METSTRGVNSGTFREEGLGKKKTSPGMKESNGKEKGGPEGNVDL